MFCAGMLRQRLFPGTGTFRTKSSRTASTDCCWIFRRAGPDDVASLLAGVRFSARVQEVNEMSRNGSKAAAPAALETPAGFHDDAVQALSASFYEIEADSWRRSAFRGILFALDHEPLGSVVEKRRADC